MVDQAALEMVVAPVVVVAQAVDQEAAQAVDQEAAAHPDLVVALQIHKYNQPIIT